MRPEELQSLLSQTLDDFRLSRAEKRALSDRLGDNELDEQDQAACIRVAFELARKNIDVVNTSSVLDWLEDVSKVVRNAASKSTPVADSEAFFSPSEASWQRIRSLLKSAAQSVDICVFTITDDRISRPILDAHRRGVSVRIITDDEKAFDRGSDAEFLARNGVPLVVDRTRHHMHHKFAIFDNKRLLSGSYNWTRSAADRNEENFLITSDRILVKTFRKQFDKLWKEYSPFE
jgi:phosphatidylserine/phosphatidylglycerophosphate/cardiolipin synthase-like enzyme